MPMEIVQLRRYPVKSMGGEQFDHVRLDRRGIIGDRWFAVEDADGHFASGKNTRRFRRRDAVFGYSAVTSGTGDVTVTGADHCPSSRTASFNATVESAPRSSQER